MKDTIDHVLPWINAWIYGERLAYLVHRETRLSLKEVTAALIERGRFYDPSGLPAPFDPSRLRNYRGAA